MGGFWSSGDTRVVIRLEERVDFFFLGFCLLEVGRRGGFHIVVFGVAREIVSQ